MQPNDPSKNSRVGFEFLHQLKLGTNLDFEPLQKSTF